MAEMKYAIENAHNGIVFRSFMSICVSRTNHLHLKVWIVTNFQDKAPWPIVKSYPTCRQVQTQNCTKSLIWSFCKSSPLCMGMMGIRTCFIRLQHMIYNAWYAYVVLHLQIEMCSVDVRDYATNNQCIFPGIHMNQRRETNNKSKPSMIWDVHGSEEGTCAKTKGPPSRIRSESRSMTFKSAPIASAKSVLFITCSPDKPSPLFMFVPTGHKTALPETDTYRLKPKFKAHK